MIRLELDLKEMQDFFPAPKPALYELSICRDELKRTMFELDGITTCIN